MKSIGISHQYACFSCRKCFKRPQFSGASNHYMTHEQRAAQVQEAGDFEVARAYKCTDCGE